MKLRLCIKPVTEPDQTEPTEITELTWNYRTFRTEPTENADISILGFSINTGLIWKNKR